MTNRAKDAEKAIERAWRYAALTDGHTDGTCLGYPECLRCLALGPPETDPQELAGDFDTDAEEAYYSAYQREWEDEQYERAVSEGRIG